MTSEFRTFYKQVWAGFPREGDDRGVNVLECLKALAPIINDSLVELFEKVVPKLVAFIEGVSIFQENSFRIFYVNKIIDLS